MDILDRGNSSVMYYILATSLLVTTVKFMSHIYNILITGK